MRIIIMLCEDGVEENGRLGRFWERVVFSEIEFDEMGMGMGNGTRDKRKVSQWIFDNSLGTGSGDEKIWKMGKTDTFFCLQDDT